MKSKHVMSQTNEAEDVRARPTITFSFMFLVMGMTGFIPLARPILDNGMDWGYVSVGLLFIGLAIGWFFIQADSPSRIAFRKLARSLTIGFYIPLSIIYLALAFYREDGGVTFSLVYLLTYWFGLFLYVNVLRAFTKKR